MDKKIGVEIDFVHLARLALAGRPQDVQLFVHRSAKKYRPTHPELAEKLQELARNAPVQSSPLRKAATATAVPVDLDSRLQLMRIEHPGELPVEPIYAMPVREKLKQLVGERENSERLLNEGLTPTRSALFVGAPGVGKTLAARWLAKALNKPLLILDLSAVMSSFLGRTGSNVRRVLDYAKSQDAVLLLDELDAIAKRRDDITEVGELKRLVTVLLQEIDDWPSTSLLLAATNHPALLDPAVWRRFEMVIDFPGPDAEQAQHAVRAYLDGVPERAAQMWEKVLATALQGRSYSEIERAILSARRAAAVSNQPIERQLTELVRSSMERLPKNLRTETAQLLIKSNTLSQRQAHELTGIARDTLRKHAREADRKDSREDPDNNGEEA
jgi:SpoVK/Ycf46/Vps4 family AAA+-type ATPase